MGKIDTGFLVSIFILFCIFPSFTTNSDVSGQESDHYRESYIKQSNESWPQMVLYQNEGILYQDDYLEISLNLSHTDTLNNTESFASYELIIDNGSIMEIEQWDDYYFWFEEGSNFLFYSYPISLGSSFIVKPNEKDINFILSIHFYMLSADERVYHEEHTFWIIGEPEIIPGVDTIEGHEIMMIYLVSLAISVPILFIIHTKTNILSRRKG